jgi:hypothetical protein
MGAPVSGDGEEGCNTSGYFRSTAFLSLLVVPTVFPSFDFSVLEMKKMRR